MARPKKILPALRDYVFSHHTDSVEVLAEATGLSEKHVQAVLDEIAATPALQKQVDHAQNAGHFIITAGRSMDNDDRRRVTPPVALDNPDLVRYDPNPELKGYSGKSQTPQATR